MAGIKGMTQSCAGLTDKQVNKIVERMYHDFCIYRPTITKCLPDYRTNVFSKRMFTGAYFEKE